MDQKPFQKYIYFFQILYYTTFYIVFVSNLYKLFINVNSAKINVSNISNRNSVDEVKICERELANSFSDEMQNIFDSLEIIFLHYLRNRIRPISATFATSLERYCIGQSCVNTGASGIHQQSSGI